MQAVVPALRITDYERATTFYLEQLGFTIDWEHRFGPNFPVFVQISRDGMEIYLTEHRGDCEPGGLVHLYVADVDAWFNELCAKGAPVTNPPNEDLPGLRMMSVSDPDGNELRIATRLED